MFKNKVEKEITKKFNRIGINKIELTDEEKTYCKMKNFLDNSYHKAMDDADLILKNAKIPFELIINDQKNKVNCSYNGIKKISRSMLLSSGKTRKIKIDDSNARIVKIRFEDRDYVKRLKTLDDQYSKFANQNVSPVDINYEKGKLIKITQEIKEIYNI